MGNRNSFCREMTDYSDIGAELNSLAHKPRIKPDVTTPPLLGAMLIGSLCLSAPVFAQSSSPVERLTQSLSERVEFDVNKFNIVGDNPLGSAKSNALLAPFVGKSRGIDDIENAAAALEKALSEKGFSFYRVSFPPQELTDGDVDLLITRFKIGRVNVKGNNYYSDKNIESSLHLLRKGKSPSSTNICLLYTSPSPRDQRGSRMPSSA